MINVAMIVKDRPKLAEQTLKSLYASDGFRLVVVDDASGKETQDLLEHCRQWAGFWLARNHECEGTGASRNRAVVLAYTFHGYKDYLYITDADCYFKTGWAQTLVDNYAIAEPLGFRILGAYNHPYHGATARYPGTTGFEIAEYCSVGTMSWLMTWDTWDKYGPFPVTRPGVSNDSDDHTFCQRIINDGFKVGAIVPHMVVNCGVTSVDRKCPGWELVERAAKEAGVYYE